MSEQSSTPGWAEIILLLLLIIITMALVGYHLDQLDRRIHMLEVARPR